MTKILTLAAAATAFVLSLSPASAQDWVSAIIAEQKRAEGQTSGRAATKQASPRVAKSEAAQKPTRSAAKAEKAKVDSDDGDRPQRKSASAARPKESLTGSGGETGVASYYWQPQPVASGGRFNPEAYTAAHKTLPFGTRVRVTRLDNGNSVDVTINDRGPYISGRIIDLSRRAARDIGMTDVGVTRVRVSRI